jgi:hypothetical protein
MLNTASITEAPIVNGASDQSKSLQELERNDWGEPTFNSALIETCHRLRRKPLADFTAEDLRIMIGQQISLPYLVPLAVERLEDDPLASTDFGPGSLLGAVVRVQQDFWSAHADLFQRARMVVGKVKGMLSTIDEIDREYIEELLTEATQSLTE